MYAKYRRTVVDSAAKRTMYVVRTAAGHGFETTYEGTPLFLSVPGVNAIRRTGSKCHRLQCREQLHLLSAGRVPTFLVCDFGDDFDIIERASCPGGFSDEAVGLTMCRHVRGWQLAARTNSQEAFERMTKDTTATAPFTMKIKVVVHRLETSSLLVPNASIAQK